MPEANEFKQVDVRLSMLRRHLKPGIYEIATKSHAVGYLESENSNTIIYTVPDGPEYKLSDDGEYYVVYEIGSLYDDDVEIASEIEGIPVTTIDVDAFTDSYVERVVIPNSVSLIKGSAFYNCKRLTSITLPDRISIIEPYAFALCTNLTSIKLPDNLTTIKNGVFRNCMYLPEIVIPSRVDSIGNYAFDNCVRLESVSFSNSVDSIADRAFLGCDALADVYYAGTEEQWNEITIGLGNECLTNATIHYVATTALSTPTIAIDGDFLIMTANDEITESFVVYVDDIKIATLDNQLGSALDLSTLNLSAGSYDIVVKSKAPGYAYPVENAYIEYVLPDIMSGLYDDNDNLVASWDELTTTYGLDVEQDNSSLEEPTSTTQVLKNNAELAAGTKLIVPNTVYKIGKYAFYNCGSLKTISIPNSVTSIGRNAFWWCTNLESLTIGKNVSNIGEGAFSGCAKLSTINVYSTNKFYCSDSYGTLFNKDKTTLIRASVAISGAYTIPSSVVRIENGAFSECSKLTNLYIPDNVEYFNASHISYNANLTYNVDSHGSKYLGSKNNPYLVLICPIDKRLADGVRTINELRDIPHAVGYGNVSVDLPDSVVHINDRAYFAFYNSMTRTGIIATSIGPNVKYIGDDIFKDCEVLSTVTIRDPNNWCKIIFEDEPPSEGSTRILQDRDGNLITDLVLDDTVTTIPSYSFQGSSIVSVTIPATVTSIGDSAFYNCTSLTDVYYHGTEEQWQSIAIGLNNEALSNATIHYNHSEKDEPQVFSLTILTNDGIELDTNTAPPTITEGETITFELFGTDEGAGSNTASLTSTATATVSYESVRTFEGCFHYIVTVSNAVGDVTITLSPAPDKPSPPDL